MFLMILSKSVKSWITVINEFIQYKKLIYAINITGPRQLPCRTPHFNGNEFDICCFMIDDHKRFFSFYLSIIEIINYITKMVKVKLMF